MTKVINRCEDRRADPCKLTPYEERLWELSKRGLSYQEMATELGSKNSRSICATMKTVRDKLAAQAYG